MDCCPRRPATWPRLSQSRLVTECTCAPTHFGEYDQDSGDLDRWKGNVLRHRQQAFEMWSVG